METSTQDTESPTCETHSAKTECWKSYFTVPEWSIFILIILVGLLLRWGDLGTRPMHHDEAQHAMFGRYFYDWPEVNFHRYNPMMHGPVLYNIYRVVYSTFGNTEAAVRAPIVLISTLLLFVPLLFRRYMTPTGVLALTGYTAISATLVFWARFIHHDLLVTAAMLCMLYGVCLAKPGNKAFFVILGVILHYCIKANVYITLALLLGFLIYELPFALKRKSAGQSMLARTIDNLKRYPLQSLLALALGAFIFCFLFGSGFSGTSGFSFRWPQGIYDGMPGPMIGYWLGQHNIERITGPFLFHFFVLSWYELVFIVAVFYQIFHFYREASNEVKITGVAIAAVTILLYSYWIGQPLEELTSFWLWGFFKLKGPLDIVGLVFLFSHAIVVTTVHLYKGEQKLAFWGYYFWANFFTYSYAGEKTPWLSIYPLIGGLIYLTFYFEEYLKAHPHSGRISLFRTLFNFGVFLLILCGAFWFQDASPGYLSVLIFGLLFIVFACLGNWLGMLGTFRLKPALFIVAGLLTLRSSYLTNFVLAGKETEFLSQVHTTYEFDQIGRQIRAEMLAPMEGVQPKVYADGTVIWPLTWYLRDLPYETSGGASKYVSVGAKYVFTDWDDNEPPKAPEGYVVRRVNLRGWWVPDYNQMTLQNFLNYSFNHIPWNPSGFSYVAMMTKVK